MPKRPVTPDSGPELCKIIAVWSPYPKNANLELPDEQADFVSWVGGCLGSTEYIHAIGWKPKAPRVVIIEISQAFTDWGRLLGLHKWEFCLRNNMPSDREAVSKVYFSSYDTHRAAEKAGWKIKILDNRWIEENFRDICVSPYPKSTWCDIEKGLDQTNYTLLRNIPVKLFPNSAPMPAPRVVPGSQKYADQKAIKTGLNGSPTKKAPGLAGAWAKPIKLPQKPTPASSQTSIRSGASTATRNDPSPVQRPPSGAPSSTASAWSGTGTHVWSGTSSSASDATSNSAASTIFDPFNSDEMDEGSYLDSNIASLSQTLSNTKLSSFDVTTNPTTNPTSLSTITTAVNDPVHQADNANENNAEEEVENVWANDIDEQAEFDALVKRALCPVHGMLSGKLCNPKMCADMERHLRREGISWEDLKVGGPANIQKIERERRRQEEAEREAKGQRQRQRNSNRRPNAAARQW